MLLRAVRARSMQSWALFAMGVAVVAGCVIASGYSRATNGSVTAAAPLLLLGVVALAGQGAASARARRFEIALAHLRGRNGLRLLRAAVTEPIVLLLAATLLGAALGWLGARAAVARWADRSSGSGLEMTEAATAAAVFLISAVVVVIVSWRTTYEPLTEKLGKVERPAAATTVAMFLSLIVVLGAGVSVYQARQLGARHASWVSFVSPALLGLAAGQLGVWLVALLARGAVTARSGNRQIGWFLTLRRLTRVADTVAVIPIVVAAVAVAGVAASAWAGAQSWQTSTARIQTGGPVAFTVSGGGLAAYAASHEADPTGKWLMAVTAAPDASGGSYRDVFVDAGRWQRVVGSFYAATPVRAVTDSIGRLEAAAGPPIATGNTATVTLTASSVHHYLPTPQQVRQHQGRPNFGGQQYAALAFGITFVDGHGNVQTVRVPAHSGTAPTPVRPGIVGYSARIRALNSAASPCDLACSVIGVDVQGITQGGAVQVAGLSFGNLRLLPVKDSGMNILYSKYLVATQTSSGANLTLLDPYTAHPLLAWLTGRAQPALSTPGLRLNRVNGQLVAYGIDGEPRPVDIAGEVPALPFLGRRGVLLDLGTSLRGASGQIPTAKTVVVARADTPAGILAALRATGVVGKARSVNETLATIRRGAAGQSTLLYSIIAVFGLLIAILSLVSTVVGQRRERRAEAASLRTVGVDSRTVASAYRREAQTLGVTVAVIAAATVWLACLSLLGVLPLVNSGRFGLPFDPTPRPSLVALVAGVAGLGVALVTFFSYRKVARSSPPRLLREDI